MERVDFWRHSCLPAAWECCSPHAATRVLEKAIPRPLAAHPQAAPPRRRRAVVPRAPGGGSRPVAARRLRPQEGRLRLEEASNLPVAQAAARAQREATPPAAAPQPPVARSRRAARRPAVDPRLRAGPWPAVDPRLRAGPRPVGEEWAARRPQGERQAGPRPQGDPRVPPGIRPPVEGTRRC